MVIQQRKERDKLARYERVLDAGVSRLQQCWRASTDGRCGCASLPGGEWAVFVGCQQPEAVLHYSQQLA